MARRDGPKQERGAAGPAGRAIAGRWSFQRPVAVRSSRFSIAELLVYEMTVAAVARLDARRTDESLVLAARAGDHGAKAELFRRHVRFASDLAYRLIGRDAEVEDVVQETFVVAFDTLDTLVDPRAFRGWLGAIVTRKTIGVIRKRRLLSRLGFVRAEPIQIESVISRNAPPDVLAELGAVYRSLDSLPAAERVVLVLRRVEQLPLEAIAERTNFSLATVKRRLQRAEQRLAEHANQTGGR